MEPSRLALGTVLTGAVLCISGCAELPPLPEVLRLRVVGENFEWRVRYPGPDALLDTEDDVEGTQDIRLPAHWKVQIEVRSRDFIYGFRIPDLGVNKMAVPDLVFVAEVQTPAEGIHDLEGDQMCGYAHESLLGRVIVESERQFQRWQLGGT